MLTKPREDPGEVFETPLFSREGRGKRVSKTLFETPLVFETPCREYKKP
jgi:hypothetical protein